MKESPFESLTKFFILAILECMLYFFIACNEASLPMLHVIPSLFSIIGVLIISLKNVLNFSKHLASSVTVSPFSKSVIFEILYISYQKMLGIQFSKITYCQLKYWTKKNSITVLILFCFLLCFFLFCFVLFLIVVILKHNYFNTCSRDICNFLFW